MERIAQGREAEVFAVDDGTVLKLWRDPGAGDRPRAELAALRALADAGVRAPAGRDVVEVEARPGLILDRVAGTDLLSLLGVAPWRVLAVGRALAEVQAGIHGVTAPPALPTVHEATEQRIRTAGALDAADRRRALDALAGLPGGDRLCHGDLHPGNLLGDVRASVAIDWGLAARGDPASDVARTELLLGLGRLPPGSSRLLATLAVGGRRLLLARYRRAYQRQRPVDRALVARWRPVRAAARIGEPIDEAEIPDLLAIVRG